MDDSVWDFLCNNSPKLVVKTRSRTPIDYIDVSQSQKKELPKIPPGPIIKPKLFARNEQLSKLIMRDISRDITPSSIPCKSPALAIRQNNKVSHGNTVTSINPKKLTPLRSKKTSPLIKKPSEKALNICKIYFNNHKP
jgi:hypothetical protein